MNASGNICKRLVPSGSIWSHLEAPRRHPGSTQEAPRRHPGGTQEAPRRHPRGTQEAPRRHHETRRAPERSLK